MNSLGNLQFLRDLQDRSRIMEVFLHLSSNVWYGITVAEEAVHIQAGNTAANTQGCIFKKSRLVMIFVYLFKTRELHCLVVLPLIYFEIEKK